MVFPINETIFFTHVNHYSLLLDRASANYASSSPTPQASILRQAQDWFASAFGEQRSKNKEQRPIQWTISQFTMDNAPSPNCQLDICQLSIHRRLCFVVTVLAPDFTEI